MARVTLELSDELRDWVQTDVLGSGRYGSVEAYVADLIGWDRAASAPPLDEDGLRAHLEAARTGGVSSRTPDEIFSDACERARELS